MWGKISIFGMDVMESVRMEGRDSTVECMGKRENSRRAREKEGRCEVEVVCWGMKKSVLLWCGWIYRKEGKRERGKR